MRKRTTGFAIVAVAALLTAACGDDDDVSSDTTTTEEVTTTAEATTTSTADRESFELWMLPVEVGDDCSEVVAVTRPATAGGGPADALDQLLAGPTADEGDVRSWFSEETAGMLNSVTVEGGVAEVDFQDFSSLLPNASTSCGSTSLLAQLDSTVLQFPEIDEVVYSFDGDRDAFYEWLQLSAPAS